MRHTPIGFFLLLILAAANASAGPGGYDRPERGFGFMRNAALERNLQGGESADRQPPETRRGRAPGMPDTSGYTAQGESRSGSQDNARRQGRMSPEERRTLRRQIDEVGHDIYAPKR